MAKILKCSDVGMDCDFVVRGETSEEVMKKAAEHARTAHGIEQIPPELAQTAQATVKDE